MKPQIPEASLLNALPPPQLNELWKDPNQGCSEEPTITREVGADGSTPHLTAVWPCLPRSLSLTHSIRAGWDKAGGRQNAGFWAVSNAYVDHSLFDFQEWTRNKLPFSLNLVTCWWACKHEYTVHGKLYFSCTPIAHPVGSLEWKLREEEMSTSLHGVNLWAAAPVIGMPLLWDDAHIWWKDSLPAEPFSGTSQRPCSLPAVHWVPQQVGDRAGGRLDLEEAKALIRQAQSSEPSHHLEGPVWPGSRS